MKTTGQLLIGEVSNYDPRIARISTNPSTNPSTNEFSFVKLVGRIIAFYGTTSLTIELELPRISTAIDRVVSIF